ncbi:MAG: 50S ribosomal protein L24 [Acidobacteriota bacterium]|jgi:large subunit ribosomal protein L24|uniref:Large ribosomal subunit protein uL24 n=1 Tax=Thermoanaerobaculum aquaticum TaxID=1312852 RepID=A0A062XUW1_9BACT|nr:50S ribosomal protein L24 [Thermoanaerobaculum aquaticum]KDA54658.1 50S ribosomal protein L24 [Thermoanaerobaculum aquaticum]
MGGFKIKKGDQVLVIAGKDRGKKGKVLRVDRQRGRVVVEHVNMIKRHTRPNPRAGVQGGIVEREAPIHISNVMVISPDSGRPSRVGIKVLEDGRRVRYAKVDGAILDQ